MKLRLFLAAACLLLISVGCAARPEPIVSSVHTLSVHVRDFDTFNAVLRLLRDDLGLPARFGDYWSADSVGERAYAAVWAGNVCLEPCGPYPTDRFDGEAKAMFFALTFLPNESSAASARALAERGLEHNGRRVYLSVTDSHMSTGNTGVCIMDQGAENRKKEDARGEEASAELIALGGGPLGIVRLQEIRVRCTSEEVRERWANLLLPVKPRKKDLWRIENSPAIRLVESDATGIEGVVFQVRSLERATEHLRGRGMLGVVADDEVEISREHTVGLALRLRE